MKTKILFLTMIGLFIATNFAFGQFTAGNLVVIRQGNGSATLRSVSTAVFLDEYTTSGGSRVSSVAMPTSASGGNAPLTQSGSASSEGFLSRSTNCQYLILVGYITDTGKVSVASSTNVGRVVGRVDALGNINTTTQFLAGGSYSGNNIRSACSVDGSAFWTAGPKASTAGVGYAAIGADSIIQLVNVNSRVVQIFNSQLYEDGSATGNYGIYTVGSGTPTSSSSVDSIPNFPTANNSPNDYRISPDGNTLYVADDGAANKNGGIQKWTLTAGNWTWQYTLLNNGTTQTNGNADTLVRGLEVNWNGTNPVIYATTTAASKNLLITVTDTGSSSTETILETAATKERFIGVAFAPNATITFTDGSSYTPPEGTPGTDDNPIGRFQLSGNINGSTINQAIITLTGTFSGINNLKLYYCTSSTFGTSNLLSTVASPSSPVTFVISTPKAITTSDGYFFVAADLDVSATGLVTASLDDQSKLTFSNAYVSNFSSANLSSSAVSLPVEITSFTAIALKTSAQLQWKTATEVNNYGFEIDRRMIRYSTMGKSRICKRERNNQFSS